MESEILLAKIAELEAKIAALELGDDAGAINDRGPCFPIPQIGSADEPWTFSCKIEKDGNGQETGRTGGWSNCRCQIGLDVDWASPDVVSGTRVISGTDTTADGTHYLKVSLNGGADGADLAQVVLGDANTESDPITGVFYIRIGTVQNGILVEPAPHFNPVIYKYL